MCHWLTDKDDDSDTDTATKDQIECVDEFITPMQKMSAVLNDQKRENKGQGTGK